ncbi:glycosyltransferase family 4 protein [Salinibacter ruber]|uniref:glycosyltransferase family 4 protein n=1 Tax=Salinibacter ruber TaxID=146919 RepID=UPI002168A679|nr:glycosyltransferase family 4 protein [Salinibacter ruber]MCS4101402.1 glycosyltransferase involved in cell wall biosynthesis [Salinibacter ruber]
MDNVVLICSSRDRNIPKKENIGGINVIRIHANGINNQICGIVNKARDKLDWADLLIENIMSVPLFTPIWTRNSLPIIAVKHHLQNNMYLNHGLFKGGIGLLLERIAFPTVYYNTPIVVNSSHTRHCLKKMTFSKWSNIYVVNPGVEYIPINAPKYNIPTISFVGHLNTDRKKVDHLIQAFRMVVKKVSDARLIIAGDGPDKKSLMKSAKDIPVKFVGYVCDKKKHEIMERSWSFASPSIKEGFGMTWVEANRHGLPVVGYDLGLQTVNESCSIMVSPGNIHALSDAMIKLLRDTSLRSSMSTAARKNASRFSWKSSSNKFREIAKGVVDSH